MDEDEIFDLSNFFEKDINIHDHKVKGVALDMWGEKSIKVHKKNLQINKFLRSFRLSLLKIITDSIKSENIYISVYAGTALAVWRDNGKMIPHDHDIDLAILESDFLNVYNILNDKTEIYVDSLCPFSLNRWINDDCTEQVLYNKVGLKRIKVYFQDSYLKSMAEQDKKYRKLLINYDRTKLFIDIFVLQKNVLTNNYHVTWNISNVYDSDRKAFPEKILLPFKSYLFEGIPVYGPNDIEKYLAIEYGYLGRDCRYDDEQQLYVKLNVSEFEALPKDIRDYMLLH